MKPIAPSHTELGVFRSVARAGFSYQKTKEICQVANMKLVDDEPELGYVRFDLQLAPDEDGKRLLSVLISESGRPPRAFLPLYYFEDYDVSREPFDQAYRLLSASLTSILGVPSSFGEYCYPHREGWLYSYCGWFLSDVTLVLVQDEFDIQFGLDVTLWVFPKDSPVATPLSL